MKLHTLWMLLGCALPMLFVPLLIRFGVNAYVALGIGMVLMAACHLFMPGHRHDEKPRDVPPEAPRNEPTNHQ